MAASTAAKNLQAARERITELEAALEAKGAAPYQIEAPSPPVPLPLEATSYPLDPSINVAVAIARVMAEMPAISKGGQAPAAMGGFSFRRIEDITAVAQKLMAKHGVVIIPRAKPADIHHFQTTNNQGKVTDWTDTRVLYGYTVMGPDGSSIDGATFGIGRDNFDKGSGKAATTAYKILLLQLFCIGDANMDIDGHDAGSDEGRVIGQGNPPANGNGGPPPIDWVALGWTTDPNDVAGAVKAHDTAMAEVAEALKVLPEDERAALIEIRKKTIGKLPFSKAQYDVWAKLADAALPPLGEDGAADALGGTEADEPEGND